ncbi:SAM-dependent methyltransferase [Paenibacillus shirakamiensis]|uniref:SAM-dependent methyltransferase n=1 Tax=Paenibacillus shirakamiensis TaxID=1265935 RepID=A0ABS4JM14_9BACL|nr:class I SAM-dependent methyltransferase [Paenibacillus shirakamiensis]MBP2002757.1 SAM-dependent methyltransferase [Paenibacillus shirakamiensis]
MDNQDNNNVTLHKEVWNTGTYEAWVKRFGTPEVAAQKLIADPAKRLGSLYKHMNSSLDGKRIMNLMGSNGNKAVALALLGAEVAVADFSQDNERYALALAEAAGVPLHYIVSDVLDLPADELRPVYDYVMMENGILHYFEDLHPLFEVVSRLLKPGGRLILQDFHPVSTKLITSKGTTANIRKHKVSGDYFSTELEEKEVAYYKYLESGGLESSTYKVYLRKWNLGEIVTSIAKTGLFMKQLEELPNQSSEQFDKGIPKTFTIVAERL